MATGHGGVGSNGRGKTKSVAGSQPPQWRCATAVAARHPSEEGILKGTFESSPPRFPRLQRGTVFKRSLLTIAASRGRAQCGN